jgi:hypothetical protein
MRPTPTTPAGDAPAHPETARRDLFACLLSLTPLATPGTDPAIAGEIPTGDGAVPDGAPQGEAGDDQDPAADLALPAIPVDFIPLLAAQAATPIVATPVTGSAKAPHANTDKVAANPASVTPTLAPTVDPTAGTAAEPNAKPAVIPTETPALPAQAILHAAIAAGIVKPESETEPKADVAVTDKETFEPAKPGKAVTLNIPAVAIGNRSTTPPVTGAIPAQAAATHAPPARAAPAQTPARGLAERADQPAPILASLPTAPLPDASPLVASLSPASSTDTTALINFARPADPSNPAIERHLDLVRDGEWLDQLARDIVRAGDGDAPMRFKLHPQTLGHLKVELTQSDQGASVRFTTETEMARNIIVDAQPRLAAEARAQGLRIAETHVDLAGSGQDQARDPRRQEDVRAGTPLRTAGQGAEDSQIPRKAPRARTDRFA